MAKFTLDDLTKSIDPKENARALSVFQGVAVDYFLKFSAANPGVKKGDRLNAAQAEELAENLIKSALTEYMKEYMGIKDPQIVDIDTNAKNLLGITSTELKLRLQNQRVTVENFAEIGKDILAKHVLDTKQQNVGVRLQDALMTSDDFRTQFDGFAKSKGYEIDKGYLTRMGPQQFFSVYSILSQQSEGLAQVLGENNVKPYKPAAPKP